MTFAPRRHRECEFRVVSAVSLSDLAIGLFGRRQSFLDQFFC